MPKVSRETIDSPTGASLNAYWAAPETPPRAIIQINHGMAEHAARYERFMNFLADSGFASVAHDYRGHGHTHAPDAPQGQFGKNGIADVLADIEAVNQAARSRFGDLPVVCFGHSLGAILALNHALRHPDAIAALTLWNNAAIRRSFLLGAMGLLLRAERMLKGSDTPSMLAQKATFDAWNREFAPNRTQFDWLSRDEAEVDEYVADPVCGFPCSNGLWLEVLGAIRFAADPGNRKQLPPDLPVYLVGGATDPASEHGKSVEQLAHSLEADGMRRVSLTIYPETRHESLNEINRDRIMEDFRDWLMDLF